MTRKLSLDDAKAVAIAVSRPVPGGSPVRTPGSSSQRKLDEGRARGWIELADEIYEALVRKS